MVASHPPSQIFDPGALQQRMQRCAPGFNAHDFLFRWAAQDILERLKVIRREFSDVLHIGGRGADFYRAAFPQLRTISESAAFSGDLMGAHEYIPVEAQSQDLILSTLALHKMNDLPGALIQIRRALKPDGLFLAAMPGGETLYALREALTQTELQLKGGVSPRVLPFADKQQMGGLLQRAGFALPVVDSDILTVTYDSLFKLMQDLRGMGESNVIAARAKTYPGRLFFMEAAQYYAQHFAEQDGRIPAHFEIIFLLGWAPHEAQPKALKPGSAKHRLADALQTKEEKPPT